MLLQVGSSETTRVAPFLAPKIIMKGWRHSPTKVRSQKIAYLTGFPWILMQFIGFQVYVNISIFDLCYIPSYLSIFIYIIFSFNFLLLLSNFIIRINKIYELNLSKLIIDILINISIFLVIFLVIFLLLTFISGYFDWRVLYAESNPNPRLLDLASQLVQGKYRVIQQRMAVGNFSHIVSLSDIGWRQPQPEFHIQGSYLYQQDLFERFIDRYPNVRGFDSYYRFQPNWNITRNLGVIITKDLLMALSTCNDHSL